MGNARDNQQRNNQKNKQHRVNDDNDVTYALFDSADFVTGEDSENFYVYIGLRTSKVALVKCLQELKAHRAATGAVMDIAGLSEDHGEHIVTVEVDFGPANKIAAYSKQSIAGWFALNEITQNMHRLQPRLCARPHDEEADRLGLLLWNSPISPDDDSHSDIDRLLAMLLGKDSVSSRTAGLAPAPAKKRHGTGPAELRD